jgi:hypothetical protein
LHEECSAFSEGLDSGDLEWLRPFSGILPLAAASDAVRGRGTQHISSEDSAG